MTNNKSNPGYELLAPQYDQVYDPVLDGRFTEIGVTKALIKRYNPNAKSLLDLGAGTGFVLGAFARQLNEVVGLDISPDMLNIARTNLPEAEFIEADMSCFALSRQFDVILCLFNSINHLKGLDSWSNCFESVDRHLSPGGIFIFDILSLRTMRKMSSVSYGSDSHQFEGGTYTLDVKQQGDDPNGFVTDFSIESDEAGVKRVEGKIYQHAYTIRQVEKVAARHFKQLVAFDFRADKLAKGQLIKVDDNSTNPSVRPTFVYTKKDRNRPTPLADQSEPQE